MSKISQYILIWKENSHFFLKMCYDEENGGDEMEYKEHNYELIKEYWNRYVAGYEEMPEHLESEISQSSMIQPLDQWGPIIPS